MRGKGDERPGHLHAGFALEIASTHGIVYTHEMKGLDGDDGRFFKDGLKGKGGTGELLEMFTFCI